MEESARNGETRASAFRVVRPTACYASPLLTFHPQFWYSGATRFPYPPSVSHYREICSSPSSAGHVVIPPNDELVYCCSKTSTSLCGRVTSSGGTGLKYHDYEKEDAGQSFLTPQTLVAPETGKEVIIHQVQAGQNCSKKESLESGPISSNLVVSSKTSLSEREERKPAPRNTTCSVCHKVFGRVTTLKVHMRIHRGEKPFECFYCGKSFSQSGNLTTHIRVHTGEKPFGCKVCGKQFSQSSALKGHMKIHLRKDPATSSSANRLTQGKHDL